MLSSTHTYMIFRPCCARIAHPGGFGQKEYSSLHPVKASRYVRQLEDRNSAGTCLPASPDIYAAGIDYLQAAI